LIALPASDPALQEEGANDACGFMI